MQQVAQQTIPANVLAVLNRAADSAAKALRSAGIPANRSDLHTIGAAVLVEQAALMGGKHPETLERPDILHKSLVIEMIEPIDADLAHEYGFAN